MFNKIRPFLAFEILANIIDAIFTDRLTTTGEADTGVIAQEVEALGLPGITTTRDDGTKAVRYERLVPVLIQAVKELSAKVTALEGS